MKPRCKVWSHYREGSITSGTRNTHATCKYCHSIFKSNSTRMKKHLFKDCKKCPEEVRRQFAEDVTKSCFGAKMERSISTPEEKVDQMKIPTVQTIPDSDDDDSASDFSSISTCIQKTSSAASSSSYTKSKQSTLVRQRTQFYDVLTKKEADELDMAFAKGIFSSALSFRTFSSPTWNEFFNKLRPAWKVPSPYVVGNTLLNKWEGIVNVYTLDRMSSAETLVLLTDGWSCVSGDAHIQFLVSTPEPIFLKSLHPRSNRHTGKFIAEECEKVMSEIENVKMEKFSAICTDHATNMIAAWKLLEDQFPWIQTYGCSAHALDLFVKDLQKIPSVGITVAEHQLVSTFFRKHQVPKSVLREYSVQLLKKHLTCSVQVATRWSSGRAMIAKNIRLIDCLKLAVCDTRCKENLKTSRVKELILDEEFWKRSEFINRLLTPLKYATDEVEADDSRVSIIPTVWCFIQRTIMEIVENAEDIMPHNELEMIKESLESRNEFTVRPVHKAANLLDPRFQGKHLTTEDMTTAENLIMKLAKDRDYPLEKLANELMEYKAHSGIVFGRSHIWIVGANMSADPFVWWKANSSGTCLGAIALILMSFPSSIACVERANKEYSNQKNKKRNRLTDDHSAKVTKISYNLRIGEREQKLRTLKSHVALSPPEEKENMSMCLNTRSGQMQNIAPKGPSSDEDDDEISDGNDDDNDDDIEPAIGGSVSSFAVEDWVAAAIDYTRSKQFRIFYGQVVSFEEKDDICVRFASMTRYRLLVWPDQDDIAMVERRRLLKINAPVEVTFSSRRPGGLQLSDDDTEKAIRHFSKFLRT